MSKDSFIDDDQEASGSRHDYLDETMRLNSPSHHISPSPNKFEDSLLEESIYFEHAVNDESMASSRIMNPVSPTNQSLKPGSNKNQGYRLKNVFGQLRLTQKMRNKD